MPAGVHHITLNVTDLEASRAFYEGLLGFGVDQDFPGEKVRLRLAEDGTRLVLRPLLPGTPAGDRFSEYRAGLDPSRSGRPARRYSGSPRRCARLAWPRPCTATGAASMRW